MRFNIRYAYGSYRLSIPNYYGGEVVSAEAYDQLTDRVKTLEDALRKYAKHKKGCTAAMSSANCSCGFKQALSATGVVDLLRENGEILKALAESSRREAELRASLKALRYGLGELGSY